MNNDLISREALKKALDEQMNFEENCRDSVFDIIDNAPAVELFCSYLSDREVRQPCVEAPCEHERPQGEIKKYKPLEHDYNVQCAVENLKTAYWSNEPEKDAKNFTQAEDIIISAICHHGYKVCKQSQGEWITTRTMIHDGNPYCSICDEENIIRSNFCPNCGASMMKGGAE